MHLIGVVNLHLGRVNWSALMLPADRWAGASLKKLDSNSKKGTAADWNRCSVNNLLALRIGSLVAVRGGAVHHYLNRKELPFS